jgi:putative ABC transport system permease protein
MTDDGLKKMMNLESVLSSLKALLFGLPLGLLASYLTYRAIVPMTYIPYVFPWVAVFICVAGVFVITWVVMRYSVSRLRGHNIAEVIRSAQV